MYAKVIIGGALLDESHEHDLAATDGGRLSVKTRRGRASGWQKTSAIPTADSEDGPDGLVFVSLNDNYSPRKVWRYDWASLRKANRFKPHVVRGIHRSFVFFVSEKNDKEFEIYPLQSQAEPAEVQAHSVEEKAPVAMRHSSSVSAENWARDPVWRDALEAYGRLRENGRTEISINLELLHQTIYEGDGPAYGLMHAMASELASGGLDGYRGAPRLVLALLQILSELPKKE